MCPKLKNHNPIQHYNMQDIIMHTNLELHLVQTNVQNA